MKTRMLVMAAVMTSVAAQAAGFRLDTGSARATAMGNAVTAWIDDASSLYYNPAGLAGRTGFDVSLGVSFILPQVSFTSDNTGNSTSTLPGVATPLNAYLAYGITEDLSIGIGIFNPFGASATWPAGWEGAGRALTSSVQTFDFNPSIAYRLHPRLKLAVGFQAMRGTVLIERGLNFIDSTGKVSLGGDAWGFGWNAGFQIEVIEKVLFVGGSYRSGVQMNFAGRAHFSDIPVEFQSLLKDQKITAGVLMPETASFGIGVKATPSLRFGVDVNVTTWGSFHDLTIAFEDPALTNPLPKNWESVASLNLGAEYDVTTSISARLGFVWDPAATIARTLTPDLPDATRYKIGAGIGWRSTFGLSVDFAYQFVLLAAQRSTAPGFSGTYAGTAHVLALNVSYHL